MNGLPGMFGSGMSETYETVRLLSFLQSSFRKYGQNAKTTCNVEFPDEFADFYQNILNITREYNDRSLISCSDYTSTECSQLNYNFWDQSNGYRERYFERVSNTGTFIGSYSGYTCDALADEISDILQKLQNGIYRSLLTQRESINESEDQSVVPATYYYYSVASIRYLNNHNSTLLYMPTKFRQHSLPLFLEGAVRMMKIQKTRHEKIHLYLAVYSLSHIHDIQ